MDIDEDIDERTLAVLRIPNPDRELSSSAKLVLQWTGPLYIIQSSKDIHRITLSIRMARNRLQIKNIAFVHIMMLKSWDSDNQTVERHIYGPAITMPETDSRLIMQELGKNKHWHQIDDFLHEPGENRLLCTL